MDWFVHKHRDKYGELKGDGAETETYFSTTASPAPLCYYDTSP